MWNNERDLMCSLLEYLRQFIESEEREDIFNAFESSKYDKDGNKIGTGLGLYITKATLSEYRGSNISVMLPRTEGFGLQIKLKMY